VQLIKLGSEVHGPEDAMMIAKAQVLFYENLKPDGKVAQSISKYTGAK
jgi:ABC-type Zn uptake system ZnuABC Zn-binding protein ZnuA